MSPQQSLVFGKGKRFSVENQIQSLTRLSHRSNSLFSKKLSPEPKIRSNLSTVQKRIRSDSYFHSPTPHQKFTKPTVSKQVSYLNLETLQECPRLPQTESKAQLDHHYFQNDVMVKKLFRPNTRLHGIRECSQKSKPARLSSYLARDCTSLEESVGFRGVFQSYKQFKKNYKQQQQQLILKYENIDKSQDEATKRFMKQIKIGKFLSCLMRYLYSTRVKE